MRYAFLLACLAAVACAVTPPGASHAVIEPVTGPAADVAEIRAMRAASNAAIARRDPAAIVASMLPAYRNLGAGALTTVSRDSMYASYQNYFTDMARLGYVRTPISIEVSVIDSTAGEFGRWVGRRRRVDGVQEVVGSYYAAWRHTSEGWRLQLETFVALSCTGSAQCPTLR